MKILITGSNGMLAKEVKEKFEKENELILTDVKKFRYNRQTKSYGICKRM